MGKTETVIDYAHHEIHEGKHFKAGFQDIAMATNDVIELLLVTNSSKDVAHFVMTAQATGAVVVQLFRSPTSSANGTLVSILNRNENSENTSEMLVYHTPTTSADGTKISEKWVGNEGFKETIGGSQRGNSEIILKKDTKYLIRLTAVSDGIKGAIGADWYESRVE